MALELTHEVIYQSIWASKADSISDSTTSYPAKIGVQVDLDEISSALATGRIARLRFRAFTDDPIDAAYSAPARGRAERARFLILGRAVRRKSMFRLISMISLMN
jgi:hypothetical protein